MESQLKEVLIRGYFEDVNREIEVSLFHLQHCDNPHKELSRLKEGFLGNIPIPYIIGYTVVRDCKIFITDEVLNVGPETILLLDEVFNYINKKKEKSEKIKILDMCTGSGVFAILLAKYTNSIVTAVDISSEALNLAKKSSTYNNVSIKFLQSDLFSHPSLKNTKYDLIVSNPPYVKTEQIINQPSFIKNFAPKLAIDGGEDGLFFLKQILMKAKKILKHKGRLFVECCDGQDKDIEIMAKQFDYIIKENYKNKMNRIVGFQLISE